MKTKSLSCHLLGFFLGINLPMTRFLVIYAEIHLELGNKSSWMDAFSNPPDRSYSLISPFHAMEMVREIRNLTEGPIYVNGFTYGEREEGVVIQLSNSTRQFTIYCRSTDGSYSVPGGQYTYLDGKKQCEKEGYKLFQNIKYQGVSSAFWNSEMWLESTNINELFSENKTIYCMLLDLSKAGQLMLEDCDNKHETVYVQDDYEQTIKKFTEKSSLPFYDPQETSTGPTRAGTEITSESTKSFENSSSISPTRQTNDSSTVKPNPVNPGAKGFNDKVQDIVGMNADIFYALVGVGSTVVLIVIICLCCCCKKKKGGTNRRLALSEDYSNPVDSLGMKDIEININSGNGEYANPQDSISTVKAKQRHSIGEGVYDVTFTSGQRKPCANPNEHPVNAYDHVTIPPKGGVRPDDTENHYDSTPHFKPQQKVFISSTHSDHTYGEVQLKPNT